MSTGKILAICGKICGGKTFYARKLLQTENAVLLSTDELTYDLIDNVQGEFYDAFCVRATAYLRKKAAEIAKAGTNVILDWGFWTAQQRKEATAFFAERQIFVEWHYLDISDEDWAENIRLRNKKVEAGEGGSDFLVTEGLKKKVLSRFEKPQQEEIAVWKKFYRE